jgi:hypothetical protein
MLTEIIDESYKKQVIFLLNNNWTGYSDYYFPAQNSVNIENKYMYKLKSFEYYFFKKDTENRKRAILFLFLDRNALNVAIVILKDFTMYNINITCLDEYYAGTVFDISYCEKDIIIYDTFMVSGNKINKSNFIDRIHEASCFIHNISKIDLPINIVDYKQDLKLLNDIKKSEELFFIPNSLPIITGINYSSFKWKPCELITFSLKVVENEENIDLYTTNFKNLKIFARIHYSDEKGKECISFIKNLENYKDNCIIDLNVDLSQCKLDILNVNTFKTIPNTIRSIEKILAIKNENINLEYLINYLQ